MGAGELVAISRLLKYTGKAIKNVANSKEGKQITAAVEKGTKNVAKKGIKLFGNCVASVTIMDLKKRNEILFNIESRTKDGENIEISDSEIKKLISYCNGSEYFEVIFFKYLLLLFSIRIRKNVKELKVLNETKLYLETVFPGSLKLMEDIKSEDELSIITRLWIPRVINSTLTEIDMWDKYKKNK